MESQIFTCAFCGSDFPDVPISDGEKTMAQHIVECDKHPMRKLLAAYQLVRSALVGLVGVGTREELERAELDVRKRIYSSTFHEEEHDGQVLMYNAIRALMETLPKEKE